MKKILLTVLTLSTYLGFAQCVDPILTDFECDEPSHPLTGAIETIANPFPSGINMSANVGIYTDNGTEGFDALLSNYGEPIDLVSNPIFHIKVYTELGTPLPLVAKVEGGTTPLEIATEIDVSNEWKEYTFDFTSVAESGNTTIVVFFNFGATDGTAADTYYVDDLFFGPSDGNNTMCEDPILTDFECDLPSQPLSGDVVTIDNPFPNGINTSPNVGEYTDSGDETFDNISFSYNMPIDLTTNNKLRLKVYTEQTTNLLVKLENGTSDPVELGNVGDQDDNIDVVNEWTEYEFDFSDQADENHQRLVLFFNAGNEQDDTETFFVDDIRWESESLSVGERLSDNTISIYPNPVKDIININAKASIDSYELIDISGKIIKREVSKNDKLSTIDVSILPAGIYFLNLKTGDTSQAFKVIKK